MADLFFPFLLTYLYIFIYSITLEYEYFYSNNKPVYRIIKKCRTYPFFFIFKERSLVYFILEPVKGTSPVLLSQFYFPLPSRERVRVRGK